MEPRLILKVCRELLADAREPVVLAESGEVQANGHPFLRSYVALPGVRGILFVGCTK
ncbi:hypothetical protein F443_18722 [Phytophthora nicotianae P1569]|uniref:Uncharacterized protein n=1 Tax=Phytophthora nicotianae P1569 TaxID=1317065 RepID=V9E9G1_PHYNI|nr:hypothetical protein F443_18722 [Phytophthora nicotianae P1569]